MSFFLPFAGAMQTTDFRQVSGFPTKSPYVITTAASRAWGLVIGWMALIFWFSGASFSAGNTAPMLGPLLLRFFPQITPEQIDIVHFAIRKFGHWSEYFVLAVLILRAVLASSTASSFVRHASYAVLGSSVFALSDEWHQSFVPSREASLIDVMVDTFGAICGAAACALLKRTPRSRNRAVL